MNEDEVLVNSDLIFKSNLRAEASRVKAKLSQTDLFVIIDHLARIDKFFREDPLLKYIVSFPFQV